MPMFTAHEDNPVPRISQMGRYVTIRWESGLSIQLDANEWAALIEAVHEVAPVEATPVADDPWGPL